VLNKILEGGTCQQNPVDIDHFDSHFNVAEIFAMAEIGCQHVTIQAHNLRALLETPDTLPPVTTTKPKHPYKQFATPERLKTLSTLDPLRGPDWDGVLATMQTDFVENGGAKLDEFINEDAVLNKRLKDATSLFLNAEEQAKVAISKVMEAKGL
jgi:transaldolase